MATQIGVNTGSANGLLANVTNPLPEPMLTWGRWHPFQLVKMAITSGIYL